MNSQEHNNNDKLKDFLNRKGAEEEAMDDFEKEAMEGFETLENAEILELKNSLDKRIHSEVIPEKRSSAGRYWAAAAALLVIAGLTVFFMQMGKLSEEKNLAIHHSEGEKAAELSPAVQAPMAEQPAVAQSIEREAPAKPEQKPSLKVVKDEQGEDRHQALMEKQMEPQEQAAPAAPAAPPFFPQNPKYVSADRVSDTMVTSQTLSTGGIISNSNSQVVTTAPVRTDDTDLAYTESMSGEPVKNKEEFKSLETEKKKPAAKPSNAKDVAATVSPASAGLGVASYPGGETALIKDLKKILEAKKLSKKFDGVLHLTKDGKVQELMITNAYELKDEQKKEIMEAVKQLSAFHCNDQPAQYHIRYRP